MSKSSVEDQLDEIRALKASAGELDQAALNSRLRPYLQNANNLVVAKAADLAREFDVRETLDDLVAAFRRFLDSPAKKDPQCWAKNSLSKALHQLGCDEARLYLEGTRIHQFEPTWGGQSDVAGTLRASCAHALVDCPELTHHALLLHLLDLVADEDKAVRAEVMRAIAQAGGDSAALLLRMRALTASENEDPAVVGYCFAGLLSIEGVPAIPFVAKFLVNQDDLSAEAAVALGETRTPEALKALLQRLHPAAEPEILPRRSIRDLFLEPAFAPSLLSSIALTRQPEAIDALLALVADNSTYAEAAVEALGNAGYGDDVRQRLEAIVDKLDSHRINLTYKRHFPT
jgi:hypothetical protein